MYKKGSESACSLLLNFQALTSDKHTAINRRVTSEIFDYNKPLNRSAYRNPRIEYISHVGAEIYLNPVEYLACLGMHPSKTAVTSTALQDAVFRKAWVSNCCMLLPETPSVWSLLPYLLTCYSFNIHKYSIDPFIGEPTNAWCLIFPEKMLARQISEADTDVQISAIEADCKQELSMQSSNRSRYIRNLSECFVMPYGASKEFIRASGDAFFNENGTDLQDGEIWDKRQHNGQIKIKRDRMICWELYRRFAAFCQASRKVPDVNITLSAAMFVKTFQFEKISPSNELHQYTLQEIETDALRDVIFSAFHESPQSLESIYGQAFATQVDYQRIKKAERSYRV